MKWHVMHGIAMHRLPRSLRRTTDKAVLLAKNATHCGLVDNHTTIWRLMSCTRSAPRQYHDSITRAHRATQSPDRHGEPKITGYTLRCSVDSCLVEHLAWSWRGCSGAMGTPSSLIWTSAFQQYRTKIVALQRCLTAHSTVDIPSQPLRLSPSRRQIPSHPARRALSTNNLH